MTDNITLLIPEKTDVEFDEVLITWTKRGGLIKRLGKYWIKDEELAGRPIAIYGNQTFSLVLAQLYDVELISPDDTLIARLDDRWIKRSITIQEIGQVKETDFPVFIKPVIPKLFVAGIFRSLPDFKQATAGLQETEQILVSNVVENIRAEARCYVMEGVVKDVALYEGDMDLSTASTFLTSFVESAKDQLPTVVVVDIAYSDSIGWFVLEFNACWGAGLNSCKAELVIDCIIGATIHK